MATEAVSPVKSHPSPLPEAPLSPIDLTEDHEHLNHTGEDSKPEDPLLVKQDITSPISPTLHQSPTTSVSPTKSTSTFHSYDEEKLHPPESGEEPRRLSTRKHKQRILDITQRATSLALSIIILGVMTHAYITFLANKDVTVQGLPIYPTLMQLWPTYMMITAGAITVLLNACVLGWRIHGAVKDFHREELYNKYWDYVMHVINGLVWLATSTSFCMSKNSGPAADPNALWGYTCSSTATNLSEVNPQIVKFYVQCELQTVSFWTAVSAVMVEVFTVAAKVFVK
jgi:hypothetical protein